MRGCIAVTTGHEDDGGTHRLLESEEAVADPAARRAIATDVREALLVVPVRGAERHLLDRLVDNQILKTPANTYRQSYILI